MAIKTAGAQKSLKIKQLFRCSKKDVPYLVQDVWSVCTGNENYTLGSVHSIHFDKQLIQCLLLFSTSAATESKI
jgi:hypothetical protein